MKHSFDGMGNKEQIKKLQKQRAREMVKYVARNISSNNIDDAFSIVENSLTYKLLMDSETGLWRRSKEDTVGMISKEMNNDIDSWVDIMIQSDKCRQILIH